MYKFSDITFKFYNIDTKKLFIQFKNKFNPYKKITYEPPVENIKFYMIFRIDNIYCEYHDKINESHADFILDYTNFEEDYCDFVGYNIHCSNFIIGWNSLTLKTKNYFNYKNYNFFEVNDLTIIGQFKYDFIVLLSKYNYVIHTNDDLHSFYQKIYSKKYMNEVIDKIFENYDPKKLNYDIHIKIMHINKKNNMQLKPIKYEEKNTRDTIIYQLINHYLK